MGLPRMTLVDKEMIPANVKHKGEQEFVDSLRTMAKKRETCTRRSGHANLDWSNYDAVKRQSQDAWVDLFDDGPLILFCCHQATLFMFSA